MVVNDHSNITLLKEIAELLNEETEIIPMLKGALNKFLEGQILKQVGFSS